MIIDFTSLKASIKSWLARGSDMDAVLDDIIMFGENRMARDLRTKHCLARFTTDTVAGFREVTLPPDFREMYNIQLNTDTRGTLAFVTPQQMDIEGRNNSGEPRLYSIIGQEIQFAPIPSAAYEVEMAYYFKPAALSADNPINEYVTNYPDILLYACLSACEAFIQNDQRIATWEAAYRRLVEDERRAEVSAQLGSTPLVMRNDDHYSTQSW